MPKISLAKTKVLFFIASKIEYESPAGLADIMLGSQWAVTLNEDLITQLHQTFKEENVKILYN